MPKYAKFMKELLANKRKLEKVSTVMLNEECYTLLQNKLPKNLKDLDSFSFPSTIGDLFVDKALADLVASINLMSCSMLKKLRFGERDHK